ncbi:MAG TPA: LiaF domain-containing protein [Acidimicrobiia bacterium]|nr:LiaF domain-containing protein [Acidimicrobiia bacterium]
MDVMLRRLLKSIIAVNVLIALGGLAARLVLTSRGGPDSDEIDLVTVFEGLHLRSNSDSFMGGSVLALFGGVVLDMRRAKLGPTGASLVVTTVFGGTSIVVPPDWRVDVDARTWVGGLDLSNEQPDDPDAPRLTIRARTLFGGFQVESRPRLEAVS